MIILSVLTGHEKLQMVKNSFHLSYSNVKENRRFPKQKITITATNFRR